MSNFINQLDNQKTYFYTDDYSVDKRINLLKKLKSILLEEEQNIYKALKKDLNKSVSESYMTEFKQIINELDYFIKNIKRLSRKRFIFNSPSALLSSKNSIKFVPYGSVLILSSFSLPFYYIFIPIIGAIACGNTVFVKLIENHPFCNELIFKIIGSVFTKSQVFVLDDKLTDEEMKEIYSLNFDMVLYAGTQKKGKMILKEFSPRFIKTLVLLINKNPVILDRTANLEIAAKKFVWAKAINAGLTFYSPSFILIHESIYNSFLENFKLEWSKQFGDGDLRKNYPRISCPKTYRELVNIIEQNRSKVVAGGNYNDETQTIDITLIESDNLKSPIMTADVLGPVVPIIKYNNVSDIFGVIEHNRTPNSIYLFSKDKELIKDVEAMTDSKILLLNDIMIQIFKNVPIGGVGNSGDVSYKRYYSFLTFTYPKIFIKGNKIGFNKRYLNEREQNYNQEDKNKGNF